jgi:hypothetical protein
VWCPFTPFFLHSHAPRTCRKIFLGDIRHCLTLDYPN